MRDIKEVFGDFYSPLKVLSYGRPWIFSVGSRGVGKSTGWAIYLIKRFIEHGEKCLYVRRTEDELQKTARGWFGNAAAILSADYPGLSVVYDGGYYKLTYDGLKEPAILGRAIPLSLEHKYKSDNFSEYYYIVYDEFMPKTKTGFLGGGTDRSREYTACHSLFVTVDRGIGRPYRNECKMVFIGNNYTLYNPIYVELGIDKYLTNGAKYCAPRGELWVVEQTGEVEATKTIKESNAYKLASPALRAYNYSNEALAEFGDSDFVEKVEDPGVCIGNYIYMGRKYGVYYIHRRGILYVSNKMDLSKLTLALTTDDMRINYYMANSYRANGLMVSLYEMFERGAIRFCSIRALNDLVDYFKLT